MAKEFFDLADHQLNGESGFKTHWGNFGYWPSASSYPEACEALAILVADAAGLDTHSHLLDCGFGCGQQLLTWINRYEVASIAGINLSQCQTDVAKNKISRLKLSNTQVALQQGDAVECIAGQNVSHIIALDCAYHFQHRERFFKSAYEALEADGRIALTDFTFSNPPQNVIKRARFFLASTLIKFAKIPKENVISVQQYQQMLVSVGFKDIEITDITTSVIQGFCHWLPGYKNNSALAANSNWTKYNITAAFLRWATRHGIIQYQLISVSK